MKETLTGNYMAEWFITNHTLKLFIPHLMKSLNIGFILNHI